MNRDPPDLGGPTPEGSAGRLEGEQPAREADRHLVCKCRHGASKARDWRWLEMAMHGEGTQKGFSKCVVSTRTATEGTLVTVASGARGWSDKASVNTAIPQNQDSPLRVLPHSRTGTEMSEHSGLTPSQGSAGECGSGKRAALGRPSAGAAWQCCCAETLFPFPSAQSQHPAASPRSQRKDLRQTSPCRVLYCVEIQREHCASFTQPRGQILQVDSELQVG